MACTLRGDAPLQVCVRERVYARESEGRESQKEIVCVCVCSGLLNMARTLRGTLRCRWVFERESECVRAREIECERKAERGERDRVQVFVQWCV